ncbi:MAG: CHAD domain-containing protein [Thermoleophilaceae bacterium]
MKARKVKGLDPEAPLGPNARRIVLVRLDELFSFGPTAVDEEDPKALHDMRIAAKRLRYVLEVTEPCFGVEARMAARQAKDIQSLLGDIHDCDEMLPRVERHIEDLREADVAAVVRAAGPEGGDLAPGATRSAPNRRSYRGLESLRTYTEARREVLFARFRTEWRRLEEERFRERVEAALA